MSVYKLGIKLTMIKGLKGSVCFLELGHESPVTIDYDERRGEWVACYVSPWHVKEYNYTL